MEVQDTHDHTMVVHLKFEKNPITIWKRRYEKSVISMKVILIDLDRKDSTVNGPEPGSIILPDVVGEDATSGGSANGRTAPSLHHEDSTVHDSDEEGRVEISVLNENDWKFKPQQQFGHVYKPDEFIWFRAQIPDFDKTAYMVDFYARPGNANGPVSDHVPDGEIPEHIGSCHILPSNIRDTWGSVTMPIAGVKRQPIGQLTVEYFLIRPLDFPGVKFNSDVSQMKLWKLQDSKLDVGHRGAGNARRTDTVAQVIENTIASFNWAARHGADLVELDVQLSADKVPVIYHDYTINITLKKRKAEVEDESIRLAVKDLTWQQLQLLKLAPVITDAKKEKWSFDEKDTPDNQPFPTLQHVFEALEPKCGVNVEIKCPMPRHDGSMEATIGFEYNEYVDVILKTVLETAGDRCIVFSCFHPDICTMIKLKQDRYPVLFLTQGLTTKWEPYRDQRTTTVQMATHFALAAGILGVNVHAEDILKERQLIKFVKSKGLVLFCWGADLNSSQVIEQVKQDGVDGVIYDKVDILNSKKPGTTFFPEDRDARLALLDIAGSIQESNEHQLNNTLSNIEIESSAAGSKQMPQEVVSLGPKEL